MERRRFLQGVGAATVGVAAGTTGFGRVASVLAADDGATPPALWLPTGLTPVLSLAQDTADPNTQRGFVSVMYVRDKLGAGAIDDWYLWLWTHDTSRTYLYTAPSILGPWTAGPVGDAPTPYPAGYLVGHFSSGDIVWDPDGQRFISTPHGVRLPTVPGNAEVSQDSFLTESSDGVTWHWLDGDSRPRLRCGPPRSPDSVHTGYGRLLRDLDGNLVRHNGRHWWIYRAQRNDAGNPIHALTPLLDAVGTIYTPYLASSPSLAQDFTQKQKAFTSTTLNLGLNNFGTFVRAGGRHHVLTTQGLPDPPLAPTKVFSIRSSGDNMTFNGLPLPSVIPTLTTGTLIEGDGYVTRDPSDGSIYLVHTCGVLVPSPAAEVWVYKGGPL